MQVYGVPTGPGRCRLINRNGTRFAKAGLPSLLMKALPAWVPHVSSHVLLEDDQVRALLLLPCRQGWKVAPSHEHRAGSADCCEAVLALRTDGGVRSPRCAVQIFLHLGEVEYAKRRAQGASVSGAYFLASQADTLVGA